MRYDDDDDSECHSDSMYVGSKDFIYAYWCFGSISHVLQICKIVIFM